MAKNSKFRRLADGLANGNILVPTLERALLRQGDAWPEEYPIKVYNKERIHDGYFHPSSDCLAPELQLYYAFFPDMLSPKPLTTEQILIFQVGSAYHSMLQSMMIHLGLITEDQVEVHFKNEDRFCSGTLDIVDMEMPNGQVMPIDIKSAGYGGNIPQVFLDKYIAQMNVYMDLGCAEPRDYGLLLIIEKQSPHRLREIVVQRDEDLLDKIYSRWRRVLEAVEFKDPSMLEFPCHEFDSRSHRECAARFVCRLGAPTGDRPPREMKFND